MDYILLAVSTIGERIKDARIAAGINQETLGAPLDITPQAISDIERGETLKFTMDTIQTLALTLRVSPCWLAFGAGPMYGEQTAKEYVDFNAIRGIIEVVGEILRRRKITLPARRYWHYIELFYEHETARPQTAGIDRDYILKKLKVEFPED